MFSFIFESRKMTKTTSLRGICYSQTLLNVETKHALKSITNKKDVLRLKCNIMFVEYVVTFKMELLRMVK